MIPYERQAKILHMLRRRELMRIEEIQKILPEISVSTLRRDLLELEKRGEIKRLSGGAVKPILTESEVSINTKAIRHITEKKYIAKLAAQQVSEGETIYLDSGSSCTFLLNELIHLNIQIVTSNTDAVQCIGEFKAEIIFLGGSYTAKLSSVAGPLTIENIKTFIFDKAFIGANGIDLTHGITTPSLIETAKKREVVQRSKKSFLLGDSSKFGLVSTVKIFDIDQIKIISDKGDKQLEKATTLIYK